MRRIKFRAWDNERMIYRGLCDRNWYTDSIRGKLVKAAMPNDLREFKIMQFIGLHDKNGKEIYEGDIIEHEELGISLKTVVEWEDDLELSCGNGDAVGFYMGRSHNGVKIIGNIYENPELLEELRKTDKNCH